MTGQDGWMAKSGGRGHKPGVIWPLSTTLVTQCDPDVSSAEQMLNYDGFLLPRIYTRVQVSMETLMEMLVFYIFLI